MPAATWWDVLGHEYHADTSKIGNSMAQLFRLSPKEYYLTHIVKRIVVEDTDDLRFGRLQHCVMWEPDRLESVLAIEPKPWNRRSPAQNAERKAWIASLDPWRITANEAEYGKALSIEVALRGDPQVWSILQRDRFCEAAMWWECAVSGLPRKAMFDTITQDDGPVIIPDLKTTREYPCNFRRSAIQYGYAYQAAWYLEAARELGYEDARYVMIAVRTEPPFDHLLWEFEEEILRRATLRNHETMQRIAEAAQTDVWEHHLSSTINKLQIPEYALS